MIWIKIKSHIDRDIDVVRNDVIHDCFYIAPDNNNLININDNNTVNANNIDDEHLSNLDFGEDFKENDGEDDQSNNLVQSTANTQCLGHANQIEILNKRLRNQQYLIANLRRRKHDLEIALDRTLAEIDPLVLIHYNYSTEQLLDFIEKAIDKLSHQKKRKPYKMAQKVIDRLWNTGILGGNLQVAIKEVGRDYYREHVFSPDKLMRMLDMNGG
jgi:hypothetical protein